MSIDSRKSFKPQKREHSTTKSTSILVSAVLVPISNYLTMLKKHSELSSEYLPLPGCTSPGSICQHIDELGLSQLAVAALGVTVKQCAAFLTQGMRNSLANSNVRALAQGLFVDAPIIEKSLSEVNSLVSTIAAPLFTFPQCLGLHIIEHCSRQSFSILYGNTIAIKVIHCLIVYEYTRIILGSEPSFFTWYVPICYCKGSLASYFISTSLLIFTKEASMCLSSLNSIGVH